MPRKTQRRSPNQNEIPETIVVGDTSALISLAVGDALKKCLKISKIIIPVMVQAELKDMSRFKDSHGKASKSTMELISKGHIEVKKVKNTTKVEKLISGHSLIDEGEAEALVLAQENKIPIMITDDFKSLADLKKVSENVEIHLSIYLLSRLVIEKIFSVSQAQSSLDKIAKGRTWESAAIYELAKKYIEDLGEIG